MAQKLGQHFLKDNKKIKIVVDALDLEANDIVIEIGPGHGELTRELRKAKKELRIVAVEKDRKLAESLKTTFLTDKKTEILDGDALKVLPFLINDSLFIARNYKLVGNIPYYITSYLLRVISELARKPKISVFTVQKEVAQRICAAPPAMNLLAASVQFWAKTEILDFIPKTSFRPQPKVDSAIIRLETVHFEEKLVKNYYRLIKILFRQPRKTILNNLKTIQTDTGGEVLTLLNKNNIDGRLRPQNLSVETVRKLAIMLYND